MSPLQQARRRAGTLVARLAFAALVTACDEPDTHPTGPAIRRLVTPEATIVGSNVIVLPTLGGTSTSAVDINDAGQVVGSSNTAEGRSHAFLWSPSGGMQDLGTLGGPTSSAMSINEAGQVVGVSEAADGRDAFHAFLWTPREGMRDLGTLGTKWSTAFGISDNAQVVGSSVMPLLTSRAFLWTAEGGMQDLGNLGAGWAQAWAINDAGQVVGYSLLPNGVSHAFLWTAGLGMQDLGTLDGEPTAASAINAVGQVVGFTWLTQPPQRAFLWVAGQGMRSLGTLGGASSAANGINDAGQIVGNSTIAGDAAQHAFLWSAQAGMEDLYPVTGLTDARAINNRGQVVGGDRVATLLQSFGGGFATGGGFYTIPGQARTKAHFTFTVKFVRGASAPNGKATFWIPGGQMDFESTAIATLVVSDNRAQFWGVGMLNGSAARFRITVVDAQAVGKGTSADAFRIELWRGASLAFDTQPGAASDAPVTTRVDGGSIQVHPD